MSSNNVLSPGWHLQEARPSEMNYLRQYLQTEAGRSQLLQHVAEELAGTGYDDAIEACFEMGAILKSVWPKTVDAPSVFNVDVAKAPVLIAFLVGFAGLPYNKVFDYLPHSEEILQSVLGLAAQEDHGLGSVREATVEILYEGPVSGVKPPWTKSHLRSQPYGTNVMISRPKTSAQSGMEVNLRGSGTYSKLFESYSLPPTHKN